MKIALISLGNFRCHAVHLLHTLLERDGFDVRSFLFKAAPFRATPYEVDLLVRLVSEHEPELIGISLISTFYKLACTVTGKLRERCNATIAWGGIHPTIRPEDCLKHADVVCVGEGEGAMVELARALRANPKADALPIKNLWFSTGDGMIKNEIRPLLQDLDSLPIPNHLSPDKVFIDANRMLDFHSRADLVETYDTMTSRGCPFGCDYCANDFLRRLYRDKGSYIRRRSVAHVMGELRLARDRYPNLQEIAFSDDVFTFDDTWLEEFCERYKREIRLPLLCYAHPNMVRDSTMKLLKDGGLKYVIMGIQSGSSRIREEFFGRRSSEQKILNAASILRKYRFRVAYDFISENPYETDDDRRETVKLITKLPRPFQLHLFSLGMFPGTKLTERALREGVIRLEDVECMSEKGYELFGGSLHLGREDKLLVWDVLYFLAKRGVPARTLLVLSRTKFFVQHIRTITKMLRYLPLDYYGFLTYSVHNRLNFFIFRVFGYARMLRRGSWRFCFRKIKQRIMKQEDTHL